MNALEEALRPLSSSGPPLLAALAKVVPDAAERDALASAIASALAEASTRATTAGGKENVTAAPAASAPPAQPQQQQQQFTPFDTAAAVMRSLSVIQPWGSFDVAFFPDEKKIVLRTAQKGTSIPANAKELVVPVPSVRAVAVLDQVPEEQAAFVLLGLKPAVALPWAAGGGGGGAASSLDCLALRIPNSAPKETLSFASGGAGEEAKPETIEGNRAVVLCAALGRCGVPPSSFLAPDPSTFTNASGGAGGKACSVRAAVKASQGHLFPLGERAIAFVKKPAFLVSLKAVRAAELSRAGGGSASFDLLLHLRSAPGDNETSKVLEFGQIPRQELAPLRKWLEERGVPLGASAEDGGGKKKGGDGDEGESDDDEESSSSDDEDDEDFDPKAAARAAKEEEEAEEEEEDEGQNGSDDDGGRPSKKSKF